MAKARPLVWLGSALEDLKSLPEPVQQDFGYALWLAQIGDLHRHSKPLRGFGGRGVLEVVEDFSGDTFRAVYTVRFPTAVYVLHVFQKKSRRGTTTPARDLDLIRNRLRAAEAVDEEAQRKGSSE